MNVIMPLFHDIGGTFCYNLQEIMLFYAMYDYILNISWEVEYVGFTYLNVIMPLFNDIRGAFCFLPCYGDDFIYASTLS